MANILIIGGSGFIGRHVVARLARDGHAICVPVRSPQREGELRLLPTVEVVPADVHDDAQLDKLVAGCDAAYATALDLHAAGVTVARIADTRTAPGEAALAAAAAAGLSVATGVTGEPAAPGILSGGAVNRKLLR